MDPVQQSPDSSLHDPSLHTAELRRRLLRTSTSQGPAAPESQPTASTPPPSNGSGAVPEGLTRRLKMPVLPSPPPSSLGVPPVEAAMETPIIQTQLLRRSAIAYGNPAPSPYAPSFAPAPEYGYAADENLQAETLRVRQENKELRKLLEEIKGILKEADENEQKLQAQIQEYEKLLAERDAQIQQLSQQLAEIEEQITKGELIPRSAAPKSRTELEEWADELERESVRLAQERKALEEEQRQLREDEKALKEQMRQAEIQMARERALLARQQIELQRLQQEIHTQLELMQRGDATFHEQLVNFRRRFQETFQSHPPHS